MKNSLTIASSSSSSAMANNSVHLPHEVIAEILLRSPVKTLLRCRCVCKSWRTLISDPHFASSHFQLTAPSNPKLFFIDSNAQKALSIDFNASLYDDSSFANASRSLAFMPPHSRPGIGGSCRGLLLLYTYTDLYIWNPSTGFHKRIPISPLTIVSNHSIEFLYGFGYDPSVDDYLILFGSYQHRSTALEIFSLRDNNWKQIEIDSHLPYRAIATSNFDENASPVAGLFLNGSIHWLVYNYETTKNVIIAFDLKEMTMLEIALPEQFCRDSSSAHYDLFEFGGLIGAWMVDSYIFQMWVMQEYAVDSSWTKTVAFPFFQVPTFSPICFTNCGHIVGTVSGGGLVKLNDKGELQENCSYCDFNFAISKMAMYTESLLSL